jgi:hypothetical protein
MLTSYIRVQVTLDSELHDPDLEQTRCSVWLTAHLVSQASVDTLFQTPGFRQAPIRSRPQLPFLIFPRTFMLARPHIQT